MLLKIILVYVYISFGKCQKPKILGGEFTPIE